MLNEAEKRKIMAFDLGPEPPRVKPKLPPKSKAEVVPWPKPLRDLALERRQLVIDACWEKTVAARRELEAARSCHRGPDDTDRAA